MSYMKFGGGALLFLILALSMFGPMSTDMYLAGMPDMVNEFGTTESILNMSLYMFILVLAVSILLTGPLSDKYGRRNVLTVSMVIYVISAALCCVMNNVYLFIIMRMLEAVGGGGALTTSFALIKDCYTGPKLKTILSICAIIGILGPILAPIFGTALINIFDWKATFWFAVGLGTVCLILGLGISSELPEQRYTGTLAGAVMKVAEVAKDKYFSIYMILTCIFMMIQLGFIAVSSYIYLNDFGQDNGTYSIAIGISCIAGLVLSIIQTKFIKTGRGNIIACFVWGMVATVMFIFVTDRSWILFMIAMIFPNANNTTARSVGFGILMVHHQGDNGSVSALLNFTTFFLGFVGMVAASMFPSDKFMLGLACIMVLTMIIYVVMWYLLKKDNYPIKGLLDS